MALPSSGSISLSQVNVELGRTSNAAINMNESVVRALFGKASGVIALSDGYGKSSRKLVQLTISANTNNYVLNTSKVTGYEAGNTDVELTINAGVVVGSASTGSYAFDVDASWNALDTVKIINNGMIVGAGGRGSGYDGASSSGGTALRVQRQSAVTNNSIIGGGGGGGGKGVRGANTIGENCYFVGGYSGGGGGAGSQAGLGALGENVQGADCMSKVNGLNGDNGTTTTGGAGKISPYWSAGYGDSGNGGALGSSGSVGGVYAPGDYGAAGACTSGNANITWLATGTRYGALN